MPFDGMVLAAVKNELAAALTGLRIEKIHQPAREEVHLVLGRPGVRYRLLLSADPGMARVHLTGRPAPNPPSPPVFCMVMRKHLEGGRISSFSQPGYDRTLTITVDARDELGRPSTRQIICEIMGRHSNIILYDPGSGTVLDGIKRYSHAVSRHREVLPGRPYVPAPAQGKINPLSLSEEEFFRLMMGNSLNNRVSDLVQKHFDGLSPLLAREIVWRAGLEPDTPLEVLGEYDLASVYRALKDLYSRAEKGEFRPTLVFDGGVPRDFAAFELNHLEGLRQAPGGMNETLDAYFTHRVLAGKMEGLRQSILSLVKKETARLEKKLSAQTADLESASGAEEYRLYGELVKANIHRLKKGDTEVWLENFFAEGCPPVKINLDSRLSPAENAQEFFRRYGKAKKILENAAIHAEATRSDLEYLAGVENSAELASTLEELDQIRAELADQGFLKPSGPGPAGQRNQDPPRPAVFVSSDGMIILAGRNNRQNDYLTMKVARPDDIWLHAREIPGSHVVIRTGGKKAVPPSTLEEAASLAALFSRARHSSKVPVDYTLRRHVIKPRGSKPGFVVYTDFKTIVTGPDPSLPERLSQREGAGNEGD
ncbi:MAG: NFACT family protein [Peptococcaceae bacterium]|nr:NFACT family protein [Peptococcaceae bacterium]